MPGCRYLNHGRRSSMYCNGNCEYLDQKHRKCLLTGKKLAYMKVSGSISYEVYEHIGFWEKDKEGKSDGDGM